MDGDLVRGRRDAADQVVGEPTPVLAPHDRLHRGDPAHVRVRRDAAQRHALGKDQNRLLVLGHEARLAQSVGEVGRVVVGAGLPLQRLATRREEVALPCDEPVQLGAAHAEGARAGDQAPEPADDPQQRAVLFVRHVGGRSRGRAAHLVVVSREKDLCLCHGETVREGLGPGNRLFTNAEFAMCVAADRSQRTRPREHSGSPVH